jgi:asparagine synthase (glutamine-hydrolysing)
LNSIENICLEIRLLIDKVVKRNLTNGILFSGGLDTSILAFAASKYSSLNAFTVAFENAPALDLKYSKIMANLLKMDHKIYFFAEKEMFSAIREVIKTLKVFDPMKVRNSVAIFVGLKLAKKNGIEGVMIGDGLDELFAGYSWLFDLGENELISRLSSMWQTMQFPSIPLARSIGMEAKTPYLDSEFKSFAMSVDPKLNIRSERGKIWGKWIIRKSFEGLLPDEIVWRVKCPIECGSGTTVFPKLFGEKISDEYFQEKVKQYLEKDQVSIRDKEQLFYYEIFRSLFGAPIKIFSKTKGELCPYCKSKCMHACGDEKSKFCRICGAYPI